MAPYPKEQDLALRLAAHWRAILRSQPYQLRLPNLVRRQLPLLVAAIGRREIAIPIRVQDSDDMSRPKDLPRHFAAGAWTLHADLDRDRQWACATIAVGSDTIQESYIDRGGPNLFDEPYAWAQSGVHENVQDNFRLRSMWLEKIRRHRAKASFWYDIALGAHIAYQVREGDVRAQPTDGELAAVYARWADAYGVQEPWAASDALARRAARLRLETPGHVIPVGILRERPAGMDLAEAAWDYLSDPKRGFGLSRRAAAAYLRIPYATLSSKRAHRKGQRSRQTAPEARGAAIPVPGTKPTDRPVHGQERT